MFAANDRTVVQPVGYLRAFHRSHPAEGSLGRKSTFQLGHTQSGSRASSSIYIGEAILAGT